MDQHAKKHSINSTHVYRHDRFLFYQAYTFSKIRSNQDEKHS